MQKPDSQLIGALQAKLAAADPIRDRLPASVEIFCVGGAVRDALMGEPSSDLDFVVVGARVDDMLAAGFTPVGKDFPVFLHPVSHDEYALARTERKSGKGYKGFVFNADPSVSLNDDLSRRDLTINAIAIDRKGEFIDPHHGQQDLGKGILRHIGPAFSEDPVRLLRLARFAARWPQFSIAPDTLALCQAIVVAGEADALVSERVWQEISKGLLELQPSRMLTMLSDCGAWVRLHAQAAAAHPHTLDALDRAAKQGLVLEGRYALLVHNAGGNTQPIDLFKAPAECIEMAGLLCRQHATLHAALTDITNASHAHPVALLEWLMSCDITRRPQRFEVLLSCLAIEHAISQEQHGLLEQLAATLTSPEAGQRAARAAADAQASQQPIADAVKTVRLAMLRDALRHHS